MSPLVCPPLPPCPFTPTGVKGSWNTQFGFFRPDASVGAGGCGAGLLAQIGERGSRSQSMGARCGNGDGCEQKQEQKQGREGAPTSVCKVSAANEHSRSPAAIGRAEQRSGGRIRAGACLSEASLRTTPDDTSSARHPEGARPLARLSFAYLFFGEAKKSKARGRRKPCGNQKSRLQAKHTRLLARPFFGYFL